VKIGILVAVLAVAAGVHAAETQRLQNLADMLKTGKTVALRVQAARELGELGAVAAPALKGALADPANSVRLEAASSLDRVGALEAAEVAPAVAPAIDDGDRRTRAQVVQILLRLGFADTASRAVLLRALGSADAEVRMKTLTGLWKSHFLGTEPYADELLSGVLARCSDKDPRVRRIALIGMRSFRPTPARVSDALLAALADSEVAASAVGSIDAMPDETLAQAASARLIDSLKTGSTPAARALAARTLADLTGAREQFAPPLLEALKTDPDPEVRAAAAQTAGTLEPEVSADALVKVVRADSSPKVRVAACYALAQMSPSNLGERLAKVIGALDAAAKDADETVRTAATSAAASLRE
jgi:HEAT repeat protein